MTQALSYALMLAFFRNDMGFGGNNGFTDFKDILGFDLQTRWHARRAAGATAVALAASYLACRLIVASRAGRVLRAIRDAESRTRFLGYRVESYKLWVFVFSAVIAGVAGALYVPQVGIINPSEFAPINSIEVVIWVAVGRTRHAVWRRRRRGAGELREDVPDRRPARGLALRLGALFVLVTLFLPRGLMGLLPARGQGEMNAASPAMPEIAAPRRRSQPKIARRRRPADRAHAGLEPARRQDSLSRESDRQLRRLQGARRADALRRSGGTALHHRTERRRQDHDDGRHHRQDAPGSGLGLVRADRSTCCALTEPQIAQAGIGRKFQKPSVFEHADRVRESGARRSPATNRSGRRCSPA